MIKHLFACVASGLAITAAFASGCGIPFTNPVTTPITTAYYAAQDERSVKRQAKDEEILARVKYKLLKDELTKGLSIKVYCFCSQVFLVGEVEQEDQESKAVSLAQSIEGVQSVSTYLLPKGEGGSKAYIKDATITARVMARLVGDISIKSTQIQITTIRGHVVLLGIVNNAEVEEMVISHANQIDGVRQVKSFIITDQ